jgi:paraquat-inducible protein B
MAKQANKTVIGAFVLGAIVLMVVGVVIFGSGKFFKKTNKFILYFEGSVKGLNIGAPVMFRGVKIGNVVDIQLVADPEDLSIRIPVIVETEPGRFQGLEEKRFGREAKERMDALIKRGLRAQLQMQSLVTGQLMIEVDFFPDKPAKFVGAQKEYPEIPTIQTPLQKLGKTIEKLPLQEIAAKLNSAFASIDRAAPKVEEGLDNLNETLKDIRKLVQNVDSQIEPLSRAIEQTVGDYGKLARDVDAQVEPLATGIGDTVKGAQKLVKDIDKRIGPLDTSIEKALKAADEAALQAKKTLAAVEGVAGKDSQLVYQLTLTLKELSSAARSIRVWADYLERHPEALLRGKGGTGRR